MGSFPFPENERDPCPFLNLQTTWLINSFGAAWVKTHTRNKTTQVSDLKVSLLAWQIKPLPFCLKT